MERRPARNWAGTLLLALFLISFLAALLAGCSPAAQPAATTTATSAAPTAAPTPAVTAPSAPTATTTPSTPTVREDGRYTKPDEVALYIHTYKKLPRNFLTKSAAARLGWEAEKGNLWDVTDRMSIGGDAFGNREGLLPNKSGRTWCECDVNYIGGFRGGERIVYSNDGLIYYSKNHYASFVRLY